MPQPPPFPPLRRQDLPPPIGRAWIPIVQTRPGRTSFASAIHLGGQTYGVWTHWTGFRSLPCWADENRCPGHQANMRLVWQAYLAGWLPDVGRKCLVCMTAQAVRSCPALLADPENCRGMLLRLHRQGNGPTAAVSASLTHARLTGELPAPFDVEGPLLHIWGIKRADLSRGETPIPDPTGAPAAAPIGAELLPHQVAEGEGKPSRGRKDGA